MDPAHCPGQRHLSTVVGWTWWIQPGHTGYTII